MSCILLRFCLFVCCVGINLLYDQGHAQVSLYVSKWMWSTSSPVVTGYSSLNKVIIIIKGFKWKGVKITRVFNLLWEAWSLAQIAWICLHKTDEQACMHMHARMHVRTFTHTHKHKQLKARKIQRVSCGERERDGQVFSQLDFNILSTTQHQVRTERWRIVLSSSVLERLYCRWLIITWYVLIMSVT